MVRPAALASRLALLLAAFAAHDDANVHGQTLEAGLTTTLVLDENGTLFAWGWSTALLGSEDDPVYGESIGDAPGEMGGGLPQLQSELANVTAVGHGQLCLVDATAPPSSGVQCWGLCDYGMCGHGRPGEYFVDIEDAPLTDLGSDAADSVVSVHGSPLGSTCSLFSSGRVKCWGRNEYGELGLGDIEDRGDEAGEMGDNLPFVDLGTDAKAVQLAVGSRYGCVVLQGRTRIKCWGDNGFGQLGLGDTEARGDGPGEMGDNLPAVDLEAEIEDIQTGWGFTCVLLAESREVKCWGRNYWGSLGTAHNNDMRLASAALPAVSVGGRVAKLTVGASHACVILEDTAKLTCWGYNSHGQLGLGLDLFHTSGKLPSELPSVAYGVPGEIAVEVSAGGWHTCVLQADDLVRCWGGNFGGQLGHGASYETWGKSASHMGANLPDSPYLPTYQSTPSPTASPSANRSTPSASPTQAPSSSPTAPAAAAGGTGLATGLGVGAAAVVALAGVAAYFRFGRSSSSAVTKETSSPQP